MFLLFVLFCFKGSQAECRTLTVYLLALIALALIWVKQQL